MKVKTGDEIYKEILEYSDVDEKHEWSDVKFISIDSIQKILKVHKRHYENTNQNIANFINSFYYELEMLKELKSKEKV